MGRAVELMFHQIQGLECPHFGERGAWEAIEIKKIAKTIAAFFSREGKVINKSNICNQNQENIQKDCRFGNFKKTAAIELRKRFKKIANLQEKRQEKTKRDRQARPPK